MLAVSHHRCLYYFSESHFLPLRYQDPAQSVKAHGRPEPRIVQGTLQVKHGDAGAEELGDVVQQQQSVPQGHHRGVLQVVVLHGDLHG